MKPRQLLTGLLCVLLLTGAIQAKSSAQIKKELQALQQEASGIAAEREALEAELEANASETQSVIARKSAIDRRIHVTEAELRNVNDQLQQYSLLIARKQLELEESEEALEAMNQLYQARLRAMEESGAVSYWSILFRANSFSDLLDRINMIREIAEADQRMLDEMHAASLQIEAERNDLQQEVARQEQLKGELVQLEQRLQTQRTEADALLLELSAASAALNEDFQAAEAEEAALRQEIIAAQQDYEDALSAEEAARLAQLNQNNAAGGSGSSGFLCPLPSGAWVTDAFGMRIHPLWGDYRMHTGVDLAANQGTSIYAIAAGTVTRAGYTDANGYYVALSHGNGYGSIYLHMTHYTVAVGDSVSQGQVIGYVGSTGWSNGPHLHLEIHVNGTPVNPMEYITLS